MDALPSLLMQKEECLRAARLFLVRRKDERDDKFDRGAVLSAAMKPLPFILPLPPFFAFWSVPVQDQAAPGPQAPQAAGPSSSTPTPWAGTSTIPGQFSPPGVADLPAVTPTNVANYFDSSGRRFASPVL